MEMKNKSKPTFVVNTITAFGGQGIRLSPHIDDIDDVKSIIWKKGGTIIVGETRRFISFTVTDDKVGEYKISVTYFDDTVVESDACTIIKHATDVKIPRPQVRRIHLNEFHMCGFGKVHFNVTDYLDALLETIDPDSTTAGATKTLLDALSKVIVDTITAGGMVEEYIIDLHSALVYCNGVIVVQESRNGYFEIYKIDSNKNDLRTHRIGQLVNVWNK